MLQRPLRRSWKHGSNNKMKSFDLWNVEQFVNISQEQFNNHFREICSTHACNLVLPSLKLALIHSIRHTPCFLDTQNTRIFFFLRRSFHSSVISKNDMLQL
ncbi:unnamed protein product [Rhizophagus irregularis]|nr:unnamed protein product [Rhizophagus irregularis]